MSNSNRVTLFLLYVYIYLHDQKRANVYSVSMRVAERLEEDATHLLLKMEQQLSTVSKIISLRFCRRILVNFVLFRRLFLFHSGDKIHKLSTVSKTCFLRLWQAFCRFRDYFSLIPETDSGELFPILETVFQSEFSHFWNTFSAPPLIRKKFTLCLTKKKIDYPLALPRQITSLFDLVKYFIPLTPSSNSMPTTKQRIMYHLLKCVRMTTKK